LRKSKNIEVGKLFITIEDLEEVGDMVPLHTHPEGEAHISIVARGGAEINDLTVEAGGIIKFVPDEPHRIKALVPNTRVINIRY